MYFMNLIANITEKVEFLKYITPFGYTDGANIVAKGELNLTYVGIGMMFAVIGVVSAYWKYNEKDIL